MIEARGLTRRFGTLTAVDGVDLSMDGCGVLGFLGPNGAGKTTTMNVLLGYVHAICIRICFSLQAAVHWISGAGRTIPFFSTCRDPAD